jgi:hypothetical protein
LERIGDRLGDLAGTVGIGMTVGFDAIVRIEGDVDVGDVGFVEDVPLRSVLERSRRPVAEVDIVDCDCNVVQDYCGTGPTSNLIWCNRLPGCKESS